MVTDRYQNRRERKTAESHNNGSRFRPASIGSQRVDESKSCILPTQSDGDRFHRSVRKSRQSRSEVSHSNGWTRSWYKPGLDGLTGPDGASNSGISQIHGTAPYYDGFHEASSIGPCYSAPHQDPPNAFQPPSDFPSTPTATHPAYYLPSITHLHQPLSYLHPPPSHLPPSNPPHSASSYLPPLHPPPTTQQLCPYPNNSEFCQPPSGPPPFIQSIDTAPVHISTIQPPTDPDPSLSKGTPLLVELPQAPRNSHSVDPPLRPTSISSPLVAVAQLFGTEQLGIFDGRFLTSAPLDSDGKSLSSTSCSSSDSPSSSSSSSTPVSSSLRSTLLNLSGSVSERPATNSNHPRSYDLLAPSDSNDSSNCPPSWIQRKQPQHQQPVSYDLLAPVGCGPDSGSVATQPSSSDQSILYGEPGILGPPPKDMKLGEAREQAGDSLDETRAGLMTTVDRKENGVRCKEEDVGIVTSQISLNPKKVDVIRRKSYKTSGGVCPPFNNVVQASDSTKNVDVVVADVNNNDPNRKRDFSVRSSSNQATAHVHQNAVETGSSSPEKKSENLDIANFNVAEFESVPWDVIKSIVASSSVSSKKTRGQISSSSSSSTSPSTSEPSTPPASCVEIETSSSSSFQGVVSLVYAVESSKARLELSYCNPENAFPPSVIHKMRRHEREEALRLGKGDRFRRKRKAAFALPSFGEHSNNVGGSYGNFVGNGDVGVGDVGHGIRDGEETGGKDSASRPDRWHVEPKIVSAYEENATLARNFESKRKVQFCSQ